ncbi:hypothetical protein [Garicola koreensis]|uniref:Uncharacterized protein n=1 Tax=Garicola koreensis TaxID=1262554 RepID=A0A7W5Y191_9MICC|nr:hypothetical protein [Garicola koreensis]MBB3667958.1 hypothetical protein [Garicola koreensis]
MTQNDDAAVSPSGLTSFLRNPWVQGALTGALALIPARKYPGWLRRGIIWAPTFAGAVGLGLLAKNQEPAGDTAQQADAPTVLKVAAAGAAAGAVASVTLAVSFWADEQIERALHWMRVPFPRAVMGAAAGASAGWMVTQENARERTQQTSRTQQASPAPQGR